MYIISTCGSIVIRGSSTLTWSISINHFANFYFSYEFKSIKNIVLPPFYFLQSIFGQIYPSIKITIVGFKKIILIFQNGSAVEWSIFISWKCWSQSSYKTCNIPSFQILLFWNWLIFAIYLFLVMTWEICNHSLRINNKAKLFNFFWWYKYAFLRVYYKPEILEQFDCLYNSKKATFKGVIYWNNIINIDGNCIPLRSKKR